MMELMNNATRREAVKPKYEAVTLSIGKIMDFSTGKIRVLISKPLIFGMGLNFQRCHRMAFVGLSDSFEQYYQSVRRSWRFGQEHPVDVHIITADTEGAVADNIRRKERQFEEMLRGMIAVTQDITKDSIRSTYRQTNDYNPQEIMVLPNWLQVA